MEYRHLWAEVVALDAFDLRDLPCIVGALFHIELFVQPKPEQMVLANALRYNYIFLHRTDF